MVIVCERRFDALPVSHTNFRTVGTLFFLLRFLHPVVRIWHVPEAAVDVPVLFVFAFCVPTLGLFAISPMADGRRFHLLVAAGILDLIHWVIAVIPVSHPAYWTLDGSVWVYPMNLAGIAHVVFTILIVLTYARNVVAERHLEAAMSSAAQEREYRKGPQGYEKGQKEWAERRYPRRRAENYFSDGRRKPRRASKSKKKNGRALHSDISPEESFDALTPAQMEAREIINDLREELVNIGNIQKRKARLRTLQREYHPDKNPPEEEEKVKEVFHYVQKWWDDVDGIFAEEYMAHLEV
eukprot:GEMP01040250.1.p1 GENE.GEMP01040250.1~~GEMP01040250.1.p1  ORF type:complete len:296 (+),score=65.78 GEMP01040250.1:343-1230(+)